MWAWTEEQIQAITDALAWTADSPDEEIRIRFDSSTGQLRQVDQRIPRTAIEKSVVEVDSEKKGVEESPTDDF